MHSFFQTSVKAAQRGLHDDVQPALRPHSPTTPLEQEWKEASSTSLFVSRTTRLNDRKGLPPGAMFDMYT